MTEYFKNDIVINKKLFHEGWNAVVGHKYQKYALRVGIILLTLWLILLFLMSHSLSNASYMNYAITEFILVLFIIFWIGFIFPSNRCKTNRKKLFGNDVEIHRTTYFYDNHLVIHSNTSDTTIDYTDILNIQTTSHMYILVCKNELGVLLSKDGFNINNGIDTITTLIQANEHKEV